MNSHPLAPSNTSGSLSSRPEMPCDVTGCVDEFELAHYELFLLKTNTLTVVHKALDAPNNMITLTVGAVNSRKICFGQSAHRSLQICCYGSRKNGLKYPQYLLQRRSRVLDRRVLMAFFMEFQRDERNHIKSHWQGRR